MSLVLKEASHLPAKTCYDTIAIVGVGLIGGSIGKAARQRGLARRVVGIGRRIASLDQAKELGLIDEATTDLAAGVADAELVIICTPVSLIAAQVLACAQSVKPGTILTDAGSTKEVIVQEIEQGLPPNVFYVGSHPLAGNHASGPEAAIADLFVARRTLVTPTNHSHADAVDRVCEFWRQLGAIVSCVSPEQHDAILAATSHLPHLVAALLAGGTPTEWLDYTASGWRDTTRIAAGNVDLWTQIVAQNRLPIGHALDKLARTLDSMRKAIAQHDDATLHQLLEIGKTTRDAVAN